MARSAARAPRPPTETWRSPQSAGAVGSSRLILMKEDFLNFLAVPSPMRRMVDTAVPAPISTMAKLASCGTVESHASKRRACSSIRTVLTPQSPNISTAGRQAPFSSPGKGQPSRTRHKSSPPGRRTARAAGRATVFAPLSAFRLRLPSSATTAGTQPSCGSWASTSSPGFRSHSGTSNVSIRAWSVGHGGSSPSSSVCCMYITVPWHS
mmetsp:Transcript_124444/g.244087  ORF Transcript_124444/g.244087 Transcript_124444/m.244087 type:complete len:209 (-) Transcript_124444:334-960(-)